MKKLLFIAIALMSISCNNRKSCRKIYTELLEQRIVVSQIRLDIHTDKSLNLSSEMDKLIELERTQCK